jgi:hypothetical protein
MNARNRADLYLPVDTFPSSYSTHNSNTSTAAAAAAAQCSSQQMLMLKVAHV